jgi:hypothetical protein
VTAGVGVAVGVTAGVGAEYLTPLLQINFLPDLIQVNFKLLEIETNPTFLQALPGLTTAEAFAANVASKSTVMPEVARALNLM